MKNEKAYVINIMGWLTIIVGIIGSFVIGNVYKSVSYSYFGDNVGYDYNWALVIMCCVSSIFIGLVVIGLAEIIELLQRNYDKNKLIEEKINNFKFNVEDKANNNKQPATEKYNESLPPL